MSDNIIKYKDFTFAPFMAVHIESVMRAMGVAGDNVPGNSLSETEGLSQNIMSNMAAQGGAFGAVIADAGKIEGWPPPPEVTNGLDEVVALLENTEKKTGVVFHRHVGVMPGDTGYFAVNPQGNVYMDYAAITGKGIVTRPHLANIMTHEAAHTYYDDTNLHGTVDLSANLLGHLVGMAECHQKKPDKFYALAGSTSNTAAEAIKALDNELTELTEAVGKLWQPLQGATGDLSEVTTETVLADMYGEGKITAALQEISSEPAFAQMAGRMKAWQFQYPVLTEEQEAAARRNIEQIRQFNTGKENAGNESGNDIYADALSYFNAEVPANIEFSAADKAQIDGIVQEKLLPLLEKQRQLKHFSEQHSLAFELRADDFAVAFAEEPKEAWRTLEIAETIMENAPRQTPDMPQMEAQEHGNPHPPIKLRIERSKKLGEYVDALREQGVTDSEILSHFRYDRDAFRRLPTQQRDSGVPWP